MAINYKDIGNRLRNSEERSRAKLLDESITPTQTREKFFSSDIFNVGKRVLLENTVYEIVDKRSNYVVVVDVTGKMFNKFPVDMEPTNESVQFPANTYKGHPISEAFAKILAESTIKDPVGVIKSIEAFNKKNYQLVIETVEKTGLDLNSILESIRTDQLQAISIIAGAMDITLSQADPQRMTDSLLKKAAMKHMTPDQKKIFGDMIGMLTKLGLNVSTNVNDKVNKFTAPVVKESLSVKPHTVEQAKKTSDATAINFDEFKAKLQHTKVGSTLHPDDTARKMRVKHLLDN